MGNSSEQATGKEIVVDVCPICRGLGTRVDPRYQKQDPICVTCKGRGKLPRFICRGCARPAFHLAKGHVPCCGRKSCEDVLVKVKTDPKPQYETYYDNQNWNGIFY